MPRSRCSYYGTVDAPDVAAVAGTVVMAGGQVTFHPTGAAYPYAFGDMTGFHRSEAGKLHVSAGGGLTHVFVFAGDDEARVFANRCAVLLVFRWVRNVLIVAVGIWMVLRLFAID
jgi:hypothetical protein